jgi:hypothetical protein
LVFMTYTCIFAIDHAEHGLEEPPRQHQLKPVNTSKTKASPGASNHKSLSSFYSPSILIMFLGCALGDRS